MVVGACRLDLQLLGCRSLKQKRAVLNRLKSRLCGRFNVAVAEVGAQDLWQRAQIGVATVSSSRVVIESLFYKLVDDVEAHLDGLILDVQTEIY